MSGGDLLNIGVSGLLAYQRSLSTTSHNISNANTPGFSRQTVQLSSNLAQPAGNGFIGTGVGVETVSRSYNAYLETSMRDTTTSLASYDAFYALATRVDKLLADSDLGMSSSISAFNSALQDVADSPSDTVAREVLLSQAESMTQQFNQLFTLVEDMRNQLNSDMQVGVAEVNRITSSIASLNQQIVLETGRSGGQPPNDLLDQRDAALLELSQYAKVSTNLQSDGALNVMIGKGQPVVIANRSYELGTVQAIGDPGRLDVTISTSSGVTSVITGQLDTGTFGGLLGFQEDVLDPALNKLGLTATGIGELFNQQHRLGMDLNGNLGTDLFSVLAPQVLTLNGTSGDVTASIADVSALTAQDYTIEYDAGAWTLTRNDTNQTVAMSGSGTALDPFVADGLEILVTATPIAGEYYEIRPTRLAAQSIDVAINGVEEIAAAAPVRSTADIANTGTGAISAGVVNDIGNAAFQTSAGQLTPPILIQFTSPTTYTVFDNTVPGVPGPLEINIPYNPATGDTVFPTPGGLDYGYRFDITGTPQTGDQFTIEYNTGGVSDNRNALLLSEIPDSKVLDGGLSSIRDTYRQMMADVSVDTRQAEQSSVAQTRVLEQVTSSHDSVSGVNLDEEAANLVRYQQAYQAAAQVISTASTLFDTLLSAVSR